MEDKVCNKCGELRSIEDFDRTTYIKSGRIAICKYCRRARAMERYHSTKNAPKLKRQKQENHLKVSYGLSLQDVADMREFQNNCCAVCGKPFTGKVVVDHNHRTGEVSALTHVKCNIMVGYIENNPDIPKLIDRYLNNFGR